MYCNEKENTQIHIEMPWMQILGLNYNLYKKDHPKKLLRSCQHIDHERGYVTTVTNSTWNQREGTYLNSKVYVSLLRRRTHKKVGQRRIVSGLEVPSLKHVNLHTAQDLPTWVNTPWQGDLQGWPNLKHAHLPEIDAGIGLLIGTHVPKALDSQC